jgi:plastocyanin
VNGYAFSPKQISLAATENFAVVNTSDAAQTVTCDPDPGGNGDNSRLRRGETQLLAIDQPGRYTCSSTLHPDAKVTVKVHQK